MDTDKLKQKILDLAIRGKLVPQDPNGETAQELIKKIQEEKTKLIKEGKIKPIKDESYIFKSSDNSYYEKFDKVRAEGHGGTIISPTYASWTVRSEFELLFGLPVKVKAKLDQKRNNK